MQIDESGKLSPEMIKAISEKLNKVNKINEKLKESLYNRRKQWEEKNITVYKNASDRFSEIRSKFTNYGYFSNMSIAELSDGLAFLSSYYYHIVELEGIAIARKTAYQTAYNNNLVMLKAIKVVSGKGFADYRAEAIVSGFEDILLPLEKEIHGANHDLSLLGIFEDKQTSRSDSIKIIIEVFKKRHDSLKDQKMLEGKNR